MCFTTSRVRIITSPHEGCKFNQHCIFIKGIQFRRQHLKIGCQKASRWPTSIQLVSTYESFPCGIFVNESPIGKHIRTSTRSQVSTSNISMCNRNKLPAMIWYANSPTRPIIGWHWYWHRRFNWMLSKMQILNKHSLLSTILSAAVVVVVVDFAFSMYHVLVACRCWFCCCPLEPLVRNVTLWKNRYDVKSCYAQVVINMFLSLPPIIKHTQHTV